MRGRDGAMIRNGLEEESPGRRCSYVIVVPRCAPREEDWSLLLTSRTRARSTVARKPLRGFYLSAVRCLVYVSILPSRQGSARRRQSPEERAVKVSSVRATPTKSIVPRFAALSVHEDTYRLRSSRRRLPRACYPRVFRAIVHGSADRRGRRTSITVADRHRSGERRDHQSRWSPRRLDTSRAFRVRSAD